jgi:predicted RNase H-like nuclease (RuvC/YqgF family)
VKEVYEMLPGQRGTEIKRLKNEVEKLKADLRGKDNEINDLKALVDYLRQFRPNKEENYNSK